MTIIRDGIAKAVIAPNKNMMVPYYLMASYGYYIRDESMFSDGYYDDLCKTLDREWDEVAHVHKHLIKREWLAAGTCMLAAHEYPAMTRGAACALLQIPDQAVDVPAPVQAPVVRARVRVRPAPAPEPIPEPAPVRTRTRVRPS